MHSEPARDPFGLLHHLASDPARAGFRRDHVKGCMREGRNWIEAQITPKLQPDVVADFRIDLGFEAPGLECLHQSAHPLGFLAGGLAETEPITIDMFDASGAYVLRCGIARTADGPLGSDQPPLSTVGVDALRLKIRILTFEPVKVPPRNAILGRYDRRGRTE